MDALNANSADSLSRKIADLQKCGNGVSALAGQLTSWRVSVALVATGCESRE